MFIQVVQSEVQETYFVDFGTDVVCVDYSGDFRRRRDSSKAVPMEFSRNNNLDKALFLKHYKHSTSRNSG